MSRYAKKTDRRPYEERSFSVRAVHRDRADLHKLAEVLIRLTLQETGESRAAREAARVPDTYRAAPMTWPPQRPPGRMNLASLATRGVVAQTSSSGGQHAPRPSGLALQPSPAALTINAPPTAVGARGSNRVRVSHR